MRYPEDELYHLIQANNPKAIINRKTVKAIKDSQRRLPPTEQYKYEIRIESVFTGPYYGPEYIHYDKYNMTMYSNIYPLKIPRGKYKKNYELIKPIYDHFGFLLRAEDIIAGDVNDSVGVVLSRHCILYEGIIKIVYDDELDLTKAILVDTLDGFVQEILHG